MSRSLDRWRCVWVKASDIWIIDLLKVHNKDFSFKIDGMQIAHVKRKDITFFISFRRNAIPLSYERLAH